MTVGAFAPLDGDPESECPAAGDAAVRLMRELCHDLIEPAATIRVLAEVAQRDVVDDDMQLRLSQIVDEAARISSICGYFLERARTNPAVRLDVVAANLASSCRLRYRGVIATVTQSVTVNVHGGVMTRIVSNLLDNACRAAGDNGRVDINVGRDGDLATITVSDSGPEHGPAACGRAGLGLSIAGSLARHIGGTLTATACDLGGWSVTVMVPGVVDIGSTSDAYVLTER